MTNSLLRIIVDHVAWNSKIDCSYAQLDDAIREALKSLVKQMNNGEKTVDFFGELVLQNKTTMKDWLEPKNENNTLKDIYENKFTNTKNN